MLILASLKRLAFPCIVMLLAACQPLTTTQETQEPQEIQETLEIVQPSAIIDAAPDELSAAVCECPQILLTPKPKPCPPIPPAVVTREQCNTELPGDLLLIGRVEKIYLMSEKQILKARIDTGAGISSLHAIDIVEFDRDGKPWVRFTIPLSGQQSITIERAVKRIVEIKQLSGTPQRRPVVIMSLRLGTVEEQVEMTLSDRADYLYPILIGRNFLRDRAIVDVSKKYIIRTAE
ncbi:MAG: ATP-dependent zinc protease [Oceanicoccus sp.]